MLAAAGRFPVGNQRCQVCPHCHQAQGGFRAVVIMPDLVVHRLLDAHHLGPQKTDCAADFINSVVHGFGARMTRAQALKLKALAEEAYQPEQYAANLPSEEAERRIDALRAEIALADSF